LCIIELYSNFTEQNYIMQNKQATQLIKKIQKEISSKKYDFSSIIEDLKKVREITMDENNPVLTKALRLAFEHLDENNAFLIEIPNDEPLDEENNIVSSKYSTENNIESLDYFLSLLTDCSKKNNLLDLREYNKAFIEM
jgi:hypothetical protein